MISYSQYADTSKIREHFHKILAHESPRSSAHPEVLDSVADYIMSHFITHCDTAYYQSFEVNGVTYRNVIGSIGPSAAPRLIVGAHYDVCGDQDGADDNASGVIGLLETCRLLSGKELPYRLELVAYTLEEPPYFRTSMMGSAIHARSLSADSSDVLGMICLEMIAYFSDQKGSQDYPIKMMKAIYGGRGDYITLVQKTGSARFSNRFGKKYKRIAQVKTKRFKGPANLPGIDFSDHLNYWAVGIPALMITDTAFYRNKNYHTEDDTLENLDLFRMSQVIDALVMTLDNWEK